MIFLEKFIENVKKYPDCKAVSDEKGFLTYKELYKMSYILASVIETDIKEKNGNIAVILPRKKETLAAFISVMFSSNAYVYSSVDAPSERLQYILEDASISTIITTKAAKDSLEIQGSYCYIFMEDIVNKCKETDEVPLKDYQFDPNFPAFITYTSGSTGKPKGVIDTYYYIENHINARHSYYVPKVSESVGNIVSFSYAASTYDLFSGIAVGANLYIFSDEELLNQNVTVQRVIEQNITTMFMIPSMIPVVFGTGEKLPIRCVITAGEKAKKIPELSCILVEIYGSSEAAAVLGRVARPEDSWDILGKPLCDSKLLLRDKEGNFIDEPGVEGELCIVNSALAKGYINLPEETEKKFVDCPLPDYGRMYVSGDIMKFDEEGNFYYCGRKDNMVKLNGQRVEMGEIEVKLAGHKDIEDVVCMVKHKNNKDILVCYYKLNNKAGTVDSDELRSYIEKRLPRYMVPQYFVQMDDFPKNINGKNDREKFPEPDYSKGLLMEQPNSDIERKVFDLVRKMLPDIEFGVTDNLLQLGLDSVTAVQIAAVLEESGLNITVTDILRKKSIRNMLSAPKEHSWFYNVYDPTKKVVVLIHGVIVASGLNSVCETLSKKYNVYVIAPFTDYILDIMPEKNYDRLCEYYIALLDRDLPENASLWGFCGYSFGGQIALTMANIWQQEKNEYVNVLMGDTFIRWIYPNKKYDLLTENDPYIVMVNERSKKYGESAINEPIDILLTKQNAVIELMNTMSTNQKYEGKVYYLDAKLDYDDATEKIKMAFVKMLYPNVEIRDFNYFHNDLYLRQDVIDSYWDIWE